MKQGKEFIFRSIWAGVCDDFYAPGMTVSHCISWKDALACGASAGPGDQYRGGRPGQVEGIRNHRPGDQRPDVFVVFSSGSRVASMFISGQ
jgi:hypothetical protein